MPGPGDLGLAAGLDGVTATLSVAVTCSELQATGFDRTKRRTVMQPPTLNVPPLLSRYSRSVQ
jgi:hypothetical protein